MDFASYIIYCISAAISAGFGDVGDAAITDLIIGDICLFLPFIIFGIISGVVIIHKKAKKQQIKSSEIEVKKDFINK